MFSSDEPCLSCDSQICPRDIWPLSPGSSRLPAIYCRRIVMLTLHLRGCKRGCRMGISRFRPSGSRLGLAVRTHERTGARRRTPFPLFLVSFYAQIFHSGRCSGTHREIYILSPAVHIYKNTHAPSNENTHLRVHVREVLFSFFIFSQENSGPSDHNPTGFSILALLICSRSKSPGVRVPRESVIWAGR